MKLYVCWGTFPVLWRPGGHPCRNAYLALKDAGHDPEVVKVQGSGIGPSFLQMTTEGRREVEEISGQRMVPVLVTDDGQVITESKRIAEWAMSHPGTSTTPA